MKFFLNILFLTSLIYASADHFVQVHYLKPPRLCVENLGERVLCHRPVRQDMPKIGIERQRDKIIVHNYGHGGSGWTLAPGCVRYLMQQFKELAEVEKDTPLTIVGAGVIGLMTAYMLKQSGHTNITVIAEKFGDLASHKAGGFCAPTEVSGKTVDPEMQLLISTIGVDAYRFYAEIARGENTDFDPRGARFVPVYLKKEEAGRLKAYVDEKVMKPGQDVVVDFSNGRRYEGMQVFDDAIFMDTGRLMASLTQLASDKIAFVQKRINSFEEIGTSCIFNCAGLGAQDLNNDETMVSGQGHLILLQDQRSADIDYMIGFQVDKGMTESGQAVSRSFYMFPKHEPGAPDTSVGVLGGTFIAGADSTTPNEQEFELLVERARDFFGV
jgi:threonine dehydrogenase-like Zn-dependent dehydrogenase